MSSDSAASKSVDSPVQPGIHEFGAKVTFADDEDGLSPFFAIAKQFDQALGNEETFEAADEFWKLNHEEQKVKAWDGKIAAREQDTFDAFREFNIGLVATTDDVGRKRVNLQFRPALPDARHVETGDRIKSLPENLPEGIRVQIDAANVDPDDCIDVLQGLAELLDVNPDYFQRSKVYNARAINLAVYVRILRDLSEDLVVGPEGLLERLAVFCPRRPGQGEYVWDNEEIIGHRNAVTLNPTGLKKLYPRHVVGKLLKCYHMKNPKKNVDPEADNHNPTYHPKLEVQYSTKYSPSEHQSVSWTPGDGDAGLFELDDLRKQLERHLHHALHWAGISLDPDANAFVSDEYWTPRPHPDSTEIHADPTDELVDQERDMATAHFVEADLTEAQRLVGEVLANGGLRQVDDVADEADVSRSTVYRFAHRLDSLVDLVDGKIGFADDVIRGRIQELLSMLDRSFDLVETGIRKLTQGTDEHISEETTLGRWARQYGAEVIDENWTIEIQCGQWSEHEIWRIVKAGLRAAGNVGSRTQYRFERATIAWTDQAGNRQTAPVGSGNGSTVRFLGGRIDDRLLGERFVG